MVSHRNSFTHEVLYIKILLSLQCTRKDKAVLFSTVHLVVQQMKIFIYVIHRKRINFIRFLTFASYYLCKHYIYFYLKNPYAFSAFSRRCNKYKSLFFYIYICFPFKKHLYKGLNMKCIYSLHQIPQRQ